jgi:hypothetical protein
MANGEDPTALEPNFMTAVDLHRILDGIDVASTSGERRRFD